VRLATARAGGSVVAAGEGDGYSSIADHLHGRWEGVRQSGRRTKQRWRRLTVDEVDGGFAGTALKMNTSVVDGDQREEEEEVELRLVGQEMWWRGGSHRGERRWRRSDRPGRDASLL
jgi:hypothetical protein